MFASGCWLSPGSSADPAPATIYRCEIGQSITFSDRPCDAGAQRYDESIEVLDVNRFLYSLGVTRRFDSRAQLSLQLLGGSDSEQNDGSPYGNSKIGGRAGLSMPLGASSWLLASLGSLKSDYDGLFFGTPREDTQSFAMLQVEFRDVLARGLAVIPRIRYIDNDSDVELYSYDRTEMGIAFRWTPQP